MLLYWKYECFVMHMLYVCVLYASCGSSQFCMTQFVNAGRVMELLARWRDMRDDRTPRTKRIQPARGWCATVGGTVQIVSTYPASP